MKFTLSWLKEHLETEASLAIKAQNKAKPIRTKAVRVKDDGKLH